MGNKILLLAVILLIGTNVFAAGNLQVNGHIATGADSSVSATAGISLDETFTAAATSAGLRMAPSYNTSSSVANLSFTGITGNVEYIGTNYGVNNLVTALSFLVVPEVSGAGTSGTSDLTVRGVWTGFRAIETTAVVKELIGVDVEMADDIGSSTLTATDITGIAVRTPNIPTMTATNAYGIFIEGVAGASNNYGIVLDGDGAGADLVFGSSQEARMYSSGGELFVEDAASNVTQISPHDTETGEWIFYSKNIKTGRVMRVNMEKLVKAVEKLTGETFMIESLEEK